MRRGNAGTVVLEARPDLIVDDLQEAPLDTKALFALGGIETQRAFAEQRHERCVHRHDAHLAVERRRSAGAAEHAEGTVWRRPL
jgi:hypothetical protein